MELRPLGTTGIQVSTVALGTWPMAGMTSLNVNDADSIATIHAAIDVGVNFFDSAYCYGADGESDKLLARALKGRRRDDLVIATKGGIHWLPDGSRASDAKPSTIRRECEESLRRLETDRVDLFYLHGPDPNTPIAETAGEMKRLLDEGKTRSVGVSNVTLEQMKQFAAVCPIAAYQPCYNMLQREIESDRLPWCIENQVAVCNYWPLMKGLLTAKFSRNHTFDPRDGRPKYPMFQGEEWQKNQDFLDQLRAIAAETGHTVAQVVVNWTIHQPGITSALCGAKRPEQIHDTAGAMGWKLSAAHLHRIADALAKRGKIVSKTAV
jgi:aryl-alcohol dehydrogenase-like predicted oxidoreductase